MKPENARGGPPSSLSGPRHAARRPPAAPAVAREQPSRPPPLPGAISSTRAAAPDPHAFLLGAHLAPADIDAAIRRAAALGVAPQRVFFREGVIAPDAYARALATSAGVGFARREEDGAPGTTGIDATGQTAEEVRAAIGTVTAAGGSPMLFVGTGERWIDPEDRAARRAVARAVHALRQTNPAASAGRRMWLWQYVAVALAAGVVIGLGVLAPEVALAGLLLLSAGLFAVVVALRVLLLVAALLPGKPHAAARGPPAAECDLPEYTLLVPLYREAAVLPDLVDALSRIDYPRAKLDIAIILEADDAETRAAVRRLTLPAHMRVIIAPDRQPRTKPKALDTALALTRGAYVAVYDAEDIPDPGQVRRAAECFLAAPGRYHCLQARLALYNARQSWITRQFTLEYAALFHGLLPALVRLKLPVPLSGTSNHFPRQVLEAMPWDPFNVTEDADLGIRIARAGGRIGLIDSDTHEEAPHRFRQWLPQRTRWLKGWMQTWLVHTREPFRALRELGAWRTLGFHALIGGFLLSALAYPVMIVALALELARPAPFATVPGSLHHIVLTVALVDAVLGVAVAFVMLVLGAVRARLSDIAVHIFTAPVYWLLISRAGWRALVQLVHNPHVWEKTEHHARK